MTLTEPQIICPDCGSNIKLTESLAAPMIAAARKEDAEKLKAREAAFAKREAEFRQQADDLAVSKADMDTKIADTLAAERAKIEAAEREKANQAAMAQLNAKARELADLQNLVKDRDAKLEAAQIKELEVIKKERALADERRELELTLEKRLSAASGEIQTKARAEAEERLGLRVAEKDEQIASMNRTIEDLQRKAAQGSQQTQGEALEVHLESILAATFPLDVFEPVKKGESGADILQRVTTATGQECGSILWETKRTKNWNNEWLAKLRNDQRAAKSDIAILVTSVLPKGVESFELVDGVWVVGVSYAAPVGALVRQSMLDVYAARTISSGQQTKTERVYDYLTGSHFKQRVEAIVEHFSTMREDLDKERRLMMRQWAKREKQIQGVIDSTVGMYGDLQGIVGADIQDIKGLELDSNLIEE